MAPYRITYRNSVETVEAKTKAAAIKQYRAMVAPTAKLKDLTPYLTVVRVKDVKPPRSVVLKCAICNESVDRKEFVGHVRRHE